MKVIIRKTSPITRLVLYINGETVEIAKEFRTKVGKRMMWDSNESMFLEVKDLEKICKILRKKKEVKK